MQHLTERREDGSIGVGTGQRVFAARQLRLNTDSPVYIWPEGQEVLFRVAEALHINDRTTVFSTKEWATIVVHCFADVVATHNNIKTVPSDKFCQTLLDRIEEEENAITSPRTHLFGCHLSFLPDFPRLTIGPVTFEKRLDWIGRAAREGSFNQTDAQELKIRWQDGQSKAR